MSALNLIDVKLLLYIFQAQGDSVPISNFAQYKKLLDAGFIERVNICENNFKKRLENRESPKCIITAKGILYLQKHEYIERN